MIIIDSRWVEAAVPGLRPVRFGYGIRPLPVLGGFPPWHALPPPPGWACSHVSDKPRRPPKGGWGISDVSPVWNLKAASLIPFFYIYLLSCSSA